MPFSSSVAAVNRARMPSLSSPRPWWLVIWLAGIAVTATLYLLPNNGPPGAHHADKFIHLFVFAAIGLPVRAARLRPQGFGAFAALNAVLAVALEVAQSFVPGREFAWLDVAANLAGLGIGMAVGARLEGMLSRRRRMRATGWSQPMPARATRAK